jgi:hypothetical protein
MSDSNWLSNLVRELTLEIFRSEERRLAKREISFVVENASLGGPTDGFYFQGRLFSDLAPHLRAKGQKGNLHSSLVPAVDEYLQDQKTTLFDKGRVQQALVVILKNCKSAQDVFDAVPNTLHEAVRSLLPAAKHLTRTREEAWTVLDNPRAYQQYLKLREKIEFYNIAKLLY